MGEQVVRGGSYVFRAPADWKVSRHDTTTAASPKPLAPEVVSVSKFSLLKPYRPAIFDKAIKELDQSAGELAQKLGGYVRKRYTTTVANQRVRQYVLLYPQNTKEPKQGDFSGRMTYVLSGKTEYELFCRWEGSGSAPDYCGRLEQTFRPA